MSFPTASRNRDRANAPSRFSRDDRQMVLRNNFPLIWCTLPVLGLDKICQAEAGQLLPDAGDVDAQSIVIHIELVVPEEVYDVAAGANLPGVFEEVVEDLDLVLAQFCRLPAVCDGAVLQVQLGAIPDKDLGGLGTGSRLSQQGRRSWPAESPDCTAL